MGVAKIQDEMIEKEKQAVVKLAKEDKLDNDTYLLKDGSLEYKKMATGNYKDLVIIKPTIAGSLALQNRLILKNVKIYRERSMPLVLQICHCIIGHLHICTNQKFLEVLNSLSGMLESERRKIHIVHSTVF